MVVQRRDGPRWLRELDDDDDDGELESGRAWEGAGRRNDASRQRCENLGRSAGRRRRETGGGGGGGGGGRVVDGRRDVRRNRDVASVVSTAITTTMSSPSRSLAVRPSALTLQPPPLSRMHRISSVGLITAARFLLPSCRSAQNIFIFIHP